MTQLLTAGIDIAQDRFKVEIVGWLNAVPISWRCGDVCGLLFAPYARRGWASRCLDPATDMWETYRLGRRAARRARGRARAARRAALACPQARDGSPLGPSGPLLRRG